MSTELGARLTRCKHFRWLPGMALVRRKQGPAGGAGLRPTHLRVALTGGHPCDPFACIADVDRLPRPVPNDPHWVPDLSDAATVGALLALVREAWGIPDLYAAPVEYVGPGPAPAWRAWAVEGPDLHVYTTSGKTEAAALVAALEAAP